MNYNKKVKQPNRKNGYERQFTELHMQIANVKRLHISLVTVEIQIEVKARYLFISIKLAKILKSTVKSICGRNANRRIFSFIAD